MPAHYRLLPLFLVLPFLLPAQTPTLPRRAFLGVSMAAAPNGQKGVRVDRVHANSTAEAAGLKPGDVMTKIGNTEPTTTAEVVATLRQFQAGQKVNFTVVRDGKTLQLEGALKTFPTLQFADLDVEYGAISTNGARQRTIVTRPKKTGRLPAVLFIQGVGCYSLDNPNDTANTETQLLNYLTRQGFVTLRVDKPGVGESEGTPCAEIDFNGEADVYRQALRALRARPDVDTQNVFIVGHSMGGVFAPLLAKEQAVKGLVVIGTTSINMMEYFTNSRRVIAAAREMSPGETDRYVRDQAACFYDYVLKDGTPTEGVCRELVEGFSFRSKAFWRTLAAQNLPALWDAFRGHVLALRGEADYVSTREEHELIADIVNHNYPGHGQFLSFADADHGLRRAASAQAAMRGDVGPFNPATAVAIGQWMNKVLTAKMGGDKSGTGAATPNLREILRMDGIENAYPRVSADGREIVFQSNRAGKWQLFRMNLDGTQQRALTDTASNNNFVDWSADGSKIAFVSDRDGNEEIYVMQHDGSAARRLTNDPGRDIHPYFSPDGKKILFNSTRGNQENFDIYEMNVDGTGLRRLCTTPDEETCARYAPDMQSILYLRGDVELANDEVFVMRPDGSGVRNLTQTPRAAEGWPTWSADGKKVIYASTEGTGRFCLFEMNADGTGKRRLTEVTRPHYDARPSVAAGLPGIVFNRHDGATIAIYYLRT
jgi:Tol biopolymer transport system component/pimeloyl-ACP methyl ester carboxylesterase